MKRAIGTAVRCLPKNIQQVTFEALYQDVEAWECFARVYQDIAPWSLFPRVAAECNIVAVQVTDEYGFIQSASSNDVIPVAQQEQAVRCIAIEPDPTNYANPIANIERTCLHDNVETRQMRAARGTPMAG